MFMHVFTGQLHNKHDVNRLHKVYYIHYTIKHVLILEKCNKLFEEKIPNSMISDQSLERIMKYCGKCKIKNYIILQIHINIQIKFDNHKIDFVKN